MEVKRSKIFKNNVFDNKKMENFLSKNTYIALQNWIYRDKKITQEQANEIANAMKTWAIGEGANHFTHWFQPLTGKTAEKHNTFMTLNDDGEAIDKFGGDALISAEADGSSFPSGGLRATFEARGYVAWDPTSPVFVYDDNGIKTLCIPATFITYNGESVDQKLPLLKSKAVLSEKAKELLKYFNRDVENVKMTAGLEQEYFLIDKNDYEKRDDIKMLGRSLFGIRAPKTQQLQDQYFGSIKDKILKYMEEVGVECAKYGIPITTRHNEVAPNQYEFAPYFEEDNIANDHNQLQMTIMSKIAERHGLVVLFHEKPFHDVNGSGKHLNFSLQDSDGVNLLQCKKERTLEFLTFVTAIVQAVHDHADLLISGIAVYGNEARLGGHEAPPSILSIFLGNFLDKAFNTIEKSDKIDVELEAKIGSNFKKMPNFEIENTDRNRTSPFAFTGNKFEFRAVGSSQNAATPMTILNTIIADSIDKIILLIKKYQKTEKKEIAILKALQDVIKRTKNIRFEKNGYSKEWQKEAEKRGLYVNKKLLTALQEFKTDANIKLFEKYDILTNVELNSRSSAWADIYNTTKLIEINTYLEILENKIIPDVIGYRSFLINNIQIAKEILPIGAIRGEKKLLEEYADLIKKLFEKKDELSKNKIVFKDKSEFEAINYSYESINPVIGEIRKTLDMLEKKTGDNHWSMLKYKNLIFY
ncbi:MAG: glutamine synthetase III [Rickettsiales bacterium]|jgi:glutamine synthetase|nr:glutamine synthetase III [Rickettsiales bacterium]